LPIIKEDKQRLASFFTFDSMIIRSLSATCRSALMAGSVSAVWLTAIVTPSDPVQTIMLDTFFLISHGT
jgi:hypothetical protein